MFSPLLSVVQVSCGASSRSLTEGQNFPLLHTNAPLQVATILTTTDILYYIQLLSPFTFSSIVIPSDEELLEDRIDELKIEGWLRYNALCPILV